jgi:hypothetical protein
VMFELVKDFDSPTDTERSPSFKSHYLQLKVGFSSGDRVVCNVICLESDMKLNGFSTLSLVTNVG